VTGINLFNSESLSLQTTRPIIIWRVFFCQKSALPWCIIASRDTTISGICGRSKSDPNFLKVFVCASLQKLRQKSCFLCIYNQVCSLVIRERSGWHQMHFHILWLHSLLLKQNKRTVNFRRKYLLPQITSTKWDKEKVLFWKKKLHHLRFYHNFKGTLFTPNHDNT